MNEELTKAFGGIVYDNPRYRFLSFETKSKEPTNAVCPKTQIIERHNVDALLFSRLA